MFMSVITIDSIWCACFCHVIVFIVQFVHCALSAHTEVEQQLLERFACKLINCICLNTICCVTVKAYIWQFGSGIVDCFCIKYSF